MSIILILLKLVRSFLFFRCNIPSNSWSVFLFLWRRQMLLPWHDSFLSSQTHLLFMEKTSKTSFQFLCSRWWANTKAIYQYNYSTWHLLDFKCWVENFDVVTAYKKWQKTYLSRQADGRDSSPRHIVSMRYCVLLVTVEMNDGETDSLCAWVELLCLSYNSAWSLGNYFFLYWRPACDITTYSQWEEGSDRGRRRGSLIEKARVLWFILNMTSYPHETLFPWAGLSTAQTRLLINSYRIFYEMFRLLKCGMLWDDPGTYSGKMDHSIRTLLD